ncbi:RVT_3 domain-containing protein, partial [Cephalotus follicularis]
GLGIILQSPDNVSTQLAYKFDFFCSNNEVEYEALILGMLTAMKKGAKSVIVKGDSKLIIKQMTGEYGIKEPVLAEYRSIAQDLPKKISKITLGHVPRTENKNEGYLATMASKVIMESQNEALFTIKRRERCAQNIKTKDKNEEKTETDWRNAILKKLQNPINAELKMIIEYVAIKEELYHKDADGILAKCVAHREAESKLEEVHKAVWGIEGLVLYRRIQRHEFYWSTMVKDAADL